MDGRLLSIIPEEIKEESEQHSESDYEIELDKINKEIENLQDQLTTVLPQLQKTTEEYQQLISGKKTEEKAQELYTQQSIDLCTKLEAATEKHDEKAKQLAETKALVEKIETEELPTLENEKKELADQQALALFNKATSTDKIKELTQSLTLLEEELQKNEIIVTTLELQMQERQKTFNSTNEKLQILRDQIKRKKLTAQINETIEEQQKIAEAAKKLNEEKERRIESLKQKLKEIDTSPKTPSASSRSPRTPFSSASLPHPTSSASLFTPSSPRTTSPSSMHSLASKEAILWCEKNQKEIFTLLRTVKDESSKKEFLISIYNEMSETELKTDKELKSCVAKKNPDIQSIIAKVAIAKKECDAKKDKEPTSPKISTLFNKSQCKITLLIDTMIADLQQQFSSQCKAHNEKYKTEDSTLVLPSGRSRLFSF